MAEEKTEQQNDLTIEQLYDELKKNISKKLNEGDIPTADLERLISLETKMNRRNPDPDLTDQDSDTGIPDRLQVKRRKYTMSDEALAQRREASKKMSEQGLATGPVTEEGKKISSQNVYKHGLYAQSFIRKHRKPCKTTPFCLHRHTTHTSLYHCL